MAKYKIVVADGDHTVVEAENHDKAVAIAFPKQTLMEVPGAKANIMVKGPRVTKYYLCKEIDDKDTDLNSSIQHKPNYKKVEYFEDTLNKRKYILRKEYNGAGLYEEKTPSGYFEHQSWLLCIHGIKLVIPSYNNYCRDEVLALVDTYKTKKAFGIKAVKRGKDVYVMHNTGVAI